MIIVAPNICGFIAETLCVYCAVRTESLTIIQVNFRLFSPMAQAQAGPSPRRPGFDPVSDHVRFVVDKMTLGQGFLLSVTFSQVSIPIFIYTLLLPEGERAKPGNLP